LESSELREYRNRWLEVAAIEREEERGNSIEKRWQQVNYLYLLGANLGILPQDEQEEIVWRRWSILKNRYELSKPS
jgi:hypothetical protein